MKSHVRPTLWHGPSGAQDWNSEDAEESQDALDAGAAATEDDDENCDDDFFLCAETVSLGTAMPRGDLSPNV